MGIFVSFMKPDRLIAAPNSAARNISIVLFACVLSILALTADLAAEQRQLMRFPDIHGSTVVFCYGEDKCARSRY